MDDSVQGQAESAPSPAADTASSAPSPSPAPSSSTTPTPDASPPDSGDTGREAKSTLLDAVLKVVPATTEKPIIPEQTTEAADADAPDPQTPDGQDQAQAPEADTDDVPDDEQAAEATPGIRKKINKLLKQRRELRAEVEAMKGHANVGAELETFAQRAQLSGDDIANTLKIAAALRSGDYKTFYEMVAPYVRTAQEYLGVVLPRDLNDRVRQGHMTEAAARDFARQRFDNQRAQITAQEAQVAQRQNAIRAVQSDVQRAVTSFETRLAANDPDYKAKAPSVRRVAQALLHERGGTINSVDDALAITRAAYDEVNKHTRAMLPKPRATTPLPNGSTQTPSARAAPKSLMEAAIQGLEISRRA